jgi:hypothetical protein
MGLLPGWTNRGVGRSLERQRTMRRVGPSRKSQVQPAKGCRGACDGHASPLSHTRIMGAHGILDCVNGGAEGLVLCDDGRPLTDCIEHSSSVGEGDRPFDYGRADNTRFHAYGNGRGCSG